MNDDSSEHPIKTLGERLNRARKNARKLSQRKNIKNLPPGNALGLAFRIGVELISAIAIGMAIGWLLDHWLGTRPWLMIVFLFLGGAAGILNVYRMASGYGYAVGYKSNEDTQEDEL
jgi:ATP synthase protein I